jgi:hypothetical protein
MKTDYYHNENPFKVWSLRALSKENVAFVVLARYNLVNEEIRLHPEYVI